MYKLKSSQRQLLEDLAKREGAGALLQKKLKVSWFKVNINGEIKGFFDKNFKLQKHVLP